MAQGNKTINDLAVKANAFIKNKENKPTVVGLGVFGVSALIFSGMIVPIALGVGAGYITAKESK